jgi:hypothetical protein
MEDEISRLSTVIKRTPAGTERDKLYHQRAKYRRALSAGKGYTPNNPKYGLNTQDEDCRTKNPKVKLHVIEQRLDHELLPTERLRLRRKREKLRKQIYESKVEEPPTLKKLKEELQ